MEPTGERNEDVNKGDAPVRHKAAEQTTAPVGAVTPRKTQRERGTARGRPGGAASRTDVNGAATQQGTGRVLRDRSTRAVPAWLRDSRSEEDEDEPGADKRRKVPNSRRRRYGESVEAAGGGQHLESAEEPRKPSTDAEALPTKRPLAQSRGKPPLGGTKSVCKTEPGTESQAAAAEELNNKDRDDIEKKGNPVLDKEPQLQDDIIDFNYQSQPPSGAEEENAPSSDEDVPFRDDLNDQSYDPEDGRFVDSLKPKRRVPPRQKDKKDKEKVPKREMEEIKTEGSDNLDSVEEEVKLEEATAAAAEEVEEDPDGPRKKGRRKKDDKTPRQPKRRKKPPVQYVRCEIEGCGTVLAHPRYLQHHIKYQHLLKKKYVCPHPNCGRLFRLQKQLLRHAKHHTDQRDYICEFCARAFKSSHNLAVHRMIHTGEKPLQCEICGFTCRQKASLNWHMKKHDADASYQFSCSICGKKFEKKDCVVAHKAKSHPEVLIAEALAANAGAVITTPASLLDLPTKPPPAAAGQDGHVQQVLIQDPAGRQVAQVSQQVNHQVVLVDQDQTLHAMQVPVTIALSPIDPPSPADAQQPSHLQLQMPVQFVQSYPAQQQNQGPILQMTFQHVGPSQQIPVLAASSAGKESFVPDNPALAPSSPPGGTAWGQTERVGVLNDDIVQLTLM
ncbi:E3 ubiquitin-protein ligase ZFP91-like [Entelurus aequoreus]|uniref:E3 ubiquitin-protein ligase ZFP91-like n=1 Tax=Entelurus aequoreus TaxID=161455 RepID=UPI002B1D4A97|nr:E3 ubiquitin-protein ligase ZFP91-like [Entelurus aequoreus]